MSRNNVPLFLCLSLSLSLSQSLVLTLSTKLPPHRRIAASPGAPSYLCNRSRSLACVQTECIPVYTECMQRQIRIYVQPGVAYPRGGAYVSRVVQWRIFCSDRAFPFALCPLNEPHTSACQLFAKRGDVMFFIGRKFFCLNKKNYISCICFSLSCYRKTSVQCIFKTRNFFIRIRSRRFYI